MDTLIGGSLNKPKNKGFNGYFAPEKKKKQKHMYFCWNGLSCFYMNLKIVFTFKIFHSHNNQNPLCRDVIEGLTLKIA